MQQQERDTDNAWFQMQQFLANQRVELFKRFEIMTQKLLEVEQLYDKKLKYIEWNICYQELKHIEVDPTQDSIAQKYQLHDDVMEEHLLPCFHPYHTTCIFRSVELRYMNRDVNN